jgi:homoaconitase/3-isopropylmalate dehydratase large subunit
MGLTLAQKIIKNHLLSGDMTVGSEIGLKIDQTLTQDATGTMAYLEFEAMGVPRVKTERSVAYIDHNSFKPVLKTRMTIAIFSRLQKNMEFIFPAPAMEFAIRCIWNASAFRAKP